MRNNFLALLFVILAVSSTSCEKTVPLSEYNDLMYEKDRLNQELEVMTFERNRLQMEVEELQNDLEDCNSDLDMCRIRSSLNIW